MITSEQVQRLGLFADWLEPLNATFERFEINTPVRMAAFIGLCAYESDNFKVLQEDLDLKVDALMRMYSRSRISEANCKKYGRRDDIKQRADRDGIANCIYGGDYGILNLGNTAPDDGSKYEPRGLFRLVGKSAYALASEELGVDFLEAPYLVELPQYAALTSGWFWKRNGFNELADAGDVEGMTRKLKGSAVGVEDRAALIANVLEVLGA